MTEKTTRIESSIFTSHHLEITDWLDGDMGLNIHKHGSDLGGVTVKRADLLAALDATANTDVAAVSKDLGEVVAERDEYRLKAVALDAERDHWQARAEKAEAAIVKVMAWAHDWRDEYGREAFKELDAILDPLRPKPAFTLPTEAGAVVEYTDHGGATQRWFRTRDSQRPWVDREGNTWHDAGIERDVAGGFTVLIEAES